METSYTFFVVVATYIIQVYCKWKEINPCPHTENVTYLDLVCGTNSLLTRIHVTSQESSTTCPGLSPHLLTAVNNCYWKNKCRLPYEYTLHKMFICDHSGSTGNKCTNCLGTGGNKHLLVGKNTCMSKRKIVDVCHSRKLPRKCGIIRSHPVYPWNYVSYHKYHKDCTKVFNLTANKGKTNVLVLGIWTFDACRADKLKLVTSSQQWIFDESSPPNNSEVFVFREQDKQLTISFRREQSKNTIGCGGFILCYKFITENEVKHYLDRNVHVCDKVGRAATVKVTVADYFNTTCGRGRDHQCCCNDAVCKEINTAQMAKEASLPWRRITFLPRSTITKMSAKRLTDQLYPDANVLYIRVKQQSLLKTTFWSELIVCSSELTINHCWRINRSSLAWWEH